MIAVVQSPDHFGEIIDEAKWERLGRDLSQPCAVEAPKRNPINPNSRSNRASPKFNEGDVVVFDVEDILPNEIQGHARIPLWRSREIWGTVLGTPHPRLGRYGHAVREGDEHEPHYRVRCQRWISVNTRAEGGLCRVYASEMATADELYETNHKQERQRETIQRGYPGLKVVLFAKEKAMAWVRDKQIVDSIKQRSFPSCEISSEASDADSFPTYVLVPESSLSAPAERRAALVRRRAHQCSIMLTILDGWMYEENLINFFLRWVASTFQSIEHERNRVRSFFWLIYLFGFIFIYAHFFQDSNMLTLRVHM